MPDNPTPVPPTSPVAAQVQDQPDFRGRISRVGEKKDGKTKAFVWSCTEWDETSQDKIVMLVNPTQVQWTIPFRVSTANVFGGTIIHSWRALDGSSRDLTKLNIVMNTGRLYSSEYFAPRENVSNVTRPGGVQFAPVSSIEKAKIFYRFCELASSPAFTSTGHPNLVSLTYRTILFPEIKMQVKFVDPLTFTENARAPFSVEYNIGLIVLKMVPPLSEMTHMSNIKASEGPLV